MYVQLGINRKFKKHHKIDWSYPNKTKNIKISIAIPVCKGMVFHIKRGLCQRIFMQCIVANQF